MPAPHSHRSALHMVCACPSSHTCGSTQCVRRSQVLAPFGLLSCTQHWLTCCAARIFLIMARYLAWRVHAPATTKRAHACGVQHAGPRDYGLHCASACSGLQPWLQASCGSTHILPWCKAPQACALPGGRAEVLGAVSQFARCYMPTRVLSRGAILKHHTRNTSGRIPLQRIALFFVWNQPLSVLDRWWQPVNALLMQRSCCNSCHHQAAQAAAVGLSRHWTCQPLRSRAEAQPRSSRP